MELNNNHLMIEELRSIILDRSITHLFVKDEEIPFLCAKYAKKVWISKDKDDLHRGEHPVNVYYNNIDISLSSTFINTDVFIIHNKTRYMKNNFNPVFRFLENNLRDRGYIVIMSSSFVDKMALNAMISLLNNSHQLEIVRDIKKRGYRYLVLKKKESRNIYGFF